MSLTLEGFFFVFFFFLNVVTLNGFEGNNTHHGFNLIALYIYVYNGSFLIRDHHNVGDNNCCFCLVYILWVQGPICN